MDVKLQCRGWGGEEGRGGVEGRAGVEWVSEQRGMGGVHMENVLRMDVVKVGRKRQAGER